MRTAMTSLAVGLAVVVPAATAAAREPVTRADAAAAARSAADQAANQLANQSATGIDDLTNGAASIDISRTSVGNYLRYGKFRMGASFALFGTNTAAGAPRTLWCVGYVEVMRAKNGQIRVAPGNVICPAG